MTTSGMSAPVARRRLATSLVALATTAAMGMSFAAAATAADSLKELADAQGFDIGFALDPNRLNESQYRQIADNEFNYVVAENAMKWDATEPNRGQFSWGQADQVADYARTSGKGLYGHTLVWHSQMPGWAENLNAAELESAMINHVNEVAGRYSGQVDAWDVVNEAFEDNGQRRNSTLQQRLGDGWIETSFRAAREADPHAKLCINDYSTDAINAKSTAIYDLVRDFKARGVPIDCVGFQSHLIVGQVPGSMQDNLERFAALGVDVRITEVDIRMQMPASQQDLQQQARDYQRVFEICLDVARCQGVTIWGISDRYSWVPDVFHGEGAALVWDDNFNRKPAYDAIATALGGTVNPDPGPDPDPGPSPDPDPDPGPDPDPDPEPGPGPDPTPGACTATLTVVNSWPGGFQGEVQVSAGNAAIGGWSTSFNLPSGTEIVNLWNGQGSSSGGSYTVTNAPYNGSVNAGASTTFGFVGSGDTAPSGSVTCASN